jgi:large subunit ribosomal protein L13
LAATTSTKCYQAKAGELNRQWFVIDATDQVVGRLAAQIAPILMGKHRPTYTPHIDTGDCVIVTNVEKVVFTGEKWQQKSYQRYSGFPGGQKDEMAWRLFQRHPERILELAVRRMMPKNKIGRHMMSKLKLCVGPEHPHQAQAPIPLAAVSGRPSSAGAIYVPEPTPKVARPRPSKVQVEPVLPSSISEDSLPPPPHEAALPEPPREEALPGPPHEAALPPGSTPPAAE